MTCKRVLSNQTWIVRFCLSMRFGWKSTWTWQNRYFFTFVFLPAGLLVVSRVPDTQSPHHRVLPAMLGPPEGVAGERDATLRHWPGDRFGENAQARKVAEPRRVRRQRAGRTPRRPPPQQLRNDNYVLASGLSNAETEIAGSVRKCRRQAPAPGPIEPRGHTVVQLGLRGVQLVQFQPGSARPVQHLPIEPEQRYNRAPQHWPHVLLLPMREATEKAPERVPCVPGAHHASHKEFHLAILGSSSVGTLALVVR